MQDDKQMIEKIGAFAGQCLTIAFDRGDHDLDRLLAGFLRCSGRPCVKKRFRVRNRGARIGPRLYDRSKIIQREACHGAWSLLAASFSKTQLRGAPLAAPRMKSSRTGSPEFAMCCLACAIVCSPK